MKKLFLTFTFTLLTVTTMFMSAQDAQAWWDDDDDYWDRPWYGGGPWYGGYGPYGGYPYGGYGGYGGYPYGGYGGYPYDYGPYGEYADPYATTDTTTESAPSGEAPAPAYPPYQGYYYGY
jgi:hypothetical protein